METNHTTFVFSYIIVLYEVPQNLVEILSDYLKGD